MGSKIRTMSPPRGRRRGRRVWIAGATFLALLAVSCDGEPAAVAGSPTGAAEITEGPSTATPSETPVDDPATDEIEVSGELLATEGTGDETCTESGDVSRCVGEPWEGDYSMSDPLLSGQAEVSMNFEMGPGDLFRWWYTGALRSDTGTWEGLNLGEIRPSGVHAGEGVWLGTGPNVGLEFHEHTYLGPGAVTSQGDMFEVTGYIHPVAIDGWEFDPASPPNGSREAVLAVTRAWNTADAGAAASLYAKDAAFVDTDGSLTVGRSGVAALVESSAEAGFRIELLPPVVVNGNYAAAAFHWTSDEDDGWMLGVFRFDEAGLILQHELIVA